MKNGTVREYNFSDCKCFIGGKEIKGLDQVDIKQICDDLLTTAVQDYIGIHAHEIISAGFSAMINEAEGGYCIFKNNI